MWEAQNYINGEFVDSNSDSFFDNTDPDGNDIDIDYIHSVKQKVEEEDNILFIEKRKRQFDYWMKLY